VSEAYRPDARVTRSYRPIEGRNQPQHA